MSVARPGWQCPGRESRVNLGGPVERLLVIDETPFESNAGIGRMRRVRASADVDLGRFVPTFSEINNVPREPIQRPFGITYLDDHLPPIRGLNPRFVRSMSLVRRELPHPNANTPAPKNRRRVGAEL